MNHRHHSARARTYEQDGLLRIDYTGSITQPTFHSLDLATLKQRLALPVTIEVMDKALTLLGQVVLDESVWPLGTPPSAAVVREDQYVAAVAFSRLLAHRGIVRMTYLVSDQQRAQSFAASVLRYRRKPLLFQ